MGRQRKILILVVKFLFSTYQWSSSYFLPQFQSFAPGWSKLTNETGAHELKQFTFIPLPIASDFISPLCYHDCEDTHSREVEQAWAR